MTRLKLLSAGLIAAAMLATPAMAREHHATSRHHAAANAYASVAPDARYVDGRGCIPAPRVGAFATQPWGNGNVPCEPASGYY
jgi:hypothetical protein